MLRATAQPNPVPIPLVGSTKFGRYPKISTEETYNMIISDKGLVDYSGYAAQLNLVEDGVGRGAYTSTASGRVISVVSNQVFLITSGIISQLVGTLTTDVGDVFIAENNNGEIAITDYSNIYVYNYIVNTFKTSTTSVSPSVTQFQIPAGLTMPGYINFQNGRLIVPGVGTSSWYLSGLNTATKWTGAGTFIGSLQSKTDTAQAPVSFPGRGNLLMLFGFTVGEPWTDQGQALFPYVKNTSFNLDYGCLNAATIAKNENMIAWISQNERSGPAIMFTTGGDIQRISTDGIDNRLANLTNPKDCFAFFFRQDGHLIYQFTFITDNLTYIYDFNTEKFFTLCDENMNYHPAKQVVFFEDTYYFVSHNDGKFYEFDTSITTYTYSLPGDKVPNVKEIPRIRITPPVRLLNQQSYIAKSLTFTIEQGQPNNITNVDVPQPLPRSAVMTEANQFILTENGFAIQTTNFSGSLNFPISEARVDLSISRDGGETFSNSWGKNMNPTGKRKSLFNYLQLGRANDTSYQLRFWGMKRFTVFDGELELYQ